MPELVTWAWPVTGRVLSWFAESTAIACLLAALAILGGRMGRPRLGPATRHVLWLMVLIKLAVPPLVHWPWSAWPPAAQSRQETIRPDDRPARAFAMGSTVVRSRKIEPPSMVASTESVAIDFSSIGKQARSEAIDRAKSAAWSSSLYGGGTILAAAWLLVSSALVFRQIWQVLRFRRLLIDAIPAPEWLVEEASSVGRRMGVWVPEIRVVARLETPMIWCLGRPVLLIPGGLIKSLESGRWRAILAHELAHLRRRDHWVRRLELAAGLIWWWNPVYWLTLRNLDHEAELACDAWVLWASPGDRITYAESLIRICSALTTTEIAVPSLGIVGSGTSFERRLTMILSERVNCRVSIPSLLAALVLGVLSWPSWTTAEAAGAKPSPVALPVAPAAIEPADDDDDDKPPAKGDAEAKKADEQVILKKKMEDLGHEMEKKFGEGSEFAKTMEGLGKEMEKKFGEGSEFARKMEGLGVEIAGKFGPNSEFTKEIVVNFGPDSDLAKELMKALGPDSDFAKEMKKLGIQINVSAKVEATDDRDQAAKAKPKAEEQAKIDAKKAALFAQKAKEMAEDRAKLEVKRSTLFAQKAKEKAEQQAKNSKDFAQKAKEKADAARAAAKPELEKRRRESRIDALQSRIEALQQELNKLKAESKEQDKEDEEG
jgi:beta-lactamase regulating signal transducer with metallopeptidase domain